MLGITDLSSSFVVLTFCPSFCRHLRRKRRKNQKKEEPKFSAFTGKKILTEGLNKQPDNALSVFPATDMIREKALHISCSTAADKGSHFYTKETFNFKMPLTQPRMDIPQYKDSQLVALQVHVCLWIFVPTSMYILPSYLLLFASPNWDVTVG